MSSRIFQSVIVQMKDATDRCMGVIDSEGFVVACSELSMIGSHLEDVETACQAQLEIMEKAMMAQEGVTEALKAADQMEWVRRCNSIRNRAEEVILQDLVYR